MGAKVVERSSSDIITLIPEEMQLQIFQFLDFAACLVAKKVCRSWKRIIAESTTIYAQYVQRKIHITELSKLSPRLSAWNSMPQHWSIINGKQIVTFSSVCQDLIAFYPPNNKQSSKFFSFTTSVPFSDRNIFLGQFGKTYFFTPQKETQLKLDSQKGVKPFIRHKLITLNTTDKAENRDFFLLEERPKTNCNLFSERIESCFPISENKVAILSSTRQITFWDLTSAQPFCYKTLQMKPHCKDPYNVGNYLILEEMIVDLSNPSLVEHGFDFQSEKIKMFGPFFCSYGPLERGMRFFAIGSDGKLEKKWSYKFDELAKPINPEKEPVITYYVEDMNDKYIVVRCWQKNAVTLFILNTLGDVEYYITKEITGETMDYTKSNSYPIFAHLSDDILVFKDPLKHTLYFWHIPAKKCIREFECINDLSSSQNAVYVQDIRFSEGKLTILLSSGHTPNSNKPVQFRVIQFDSQFNVPSGFWGMFSRVCSSAKGVFFRDKNPS